MVLDLFSRAVVGLPTNTRINADQVCAALQRAGWKYRPTLWSIFHSDRGGQYTNRKFRSLLSAQVPYFIQSNGGRRSITLSRGRLFYVMAETLNGEHFLKREEAHQHLLDCIERFYYNNRLHPSPGYNTPREVLVGFNQRHCSLTQCSQN